METIASKNANQVQHRVEQKTTNHSNQRETQSTGGYDKHQGDTQAVLVEAALYSSLNFLPTKPKKASFRIYFNDAREYSQLDINLECSALDLKRKIGNGYILSRDSTGYPVSLHLTPDQIRIEIAPEQYLDEDTKTLSSYGYDSGVGGYGSGHLYVTLIDKSALQVKSGHIHFQVEFNGRSARWYRHVTVLPTSTFLELKNNVIREFEAHKDFDLINNTIEFITGPNQFLSDSDNERVVSSGTFTPWDGDGKPHVYAVNLGLKKRPLSQFCVEFKGSTSTVYRNVAVLPTLTILELKNKIIKKFEKVEGFDLATNEVEFKTGPYECLSDDEEVLSSTGFAPSDDKVGGHGVHLYLRQKSPPFDYTHFDVRFDGYRGTRYVRIAVLPTLTVLELKNKVIEAFNADEHWQNKEDSGLIFNEIEFITGVRQCLPASFDKRVLSSITFTPFDNGRPRPNVDHLHIRRKPCVKKS